MLVYDLPYLHDANDSRRGLKCFGALKDGVLAIYPKYRTASLLPSLPPPQR
jgi:hypothetical protein